jgi:hypothetical protein
MATYGSGGVTELNSGVSSCPGARPCGDVEQTKRRAEYAYQSRVTARAPAGGARVEAQDALRSGGPAS